MGTEFEDRYQDVLQNIESAIVSVYRAEATLADYDVDVVLNALLAEFKAEQQNRSNRLPAFSPVRQLVYARVKAACEWHLGRQNVLEEGEGGYLLMPTPISLDEVMACLKRIRKSVDMWTRRGGRQGYLHFVEQFIP